MANGSRSAHPNALPNYQNAVILREKLEKYVLDPTNPVRKHKAIVFESALGFIRSNWYLLAKTILDELLYYESVSGRQDTYGQRYNIIMLLSGPNGKTANVLTAWIINAGEDHPRFVTAMVQ